MSDYEARSHETLPLTPGTAIARMCRLVYDAHEKLNGFHDPCDCFCPGRWKDEGCWRADEQTYAFVERAVRDAIARLPLRTERDTTSPSSGNE